MVIIRSTSENYPHPSDKAPKSYRGDFARKFEVLSKKNIPRGPLALFVELVGRIYRALLFDLTLNWQTHMHAEHMSQGSLSGNPTDIAIKKTIGLLKRLPSPPEDLLKSLTYAHKFRRNQLKPAQVKEDIQKLKTGESLALTSNSKKHAMMLFITRTGESTFTVVQHNMGEMIGDYHYNLTDSTGKQRFQTALEITDVSQSDLTAKDAPFIERLIRCNNSGTTKELYESILPLLHGTIAPPSTDPRLWSHGQLGGSCSAAAPLALIRSQLSKEAYKEFRELGRLEMILKSYKQITTGWGNTATQKAVTLEAVKALEKSIAKRNQELPHALKTIKEKLETKKQQPIKEPPVGNLADNLNHTLYILQKNRFSQEAIKSSRKYLERALEESSKPLTKSDLRKYVKIVNSLAKYCEDRPLTKDQIYMLTSIVTAIKNYERWFQTDKVFDKKLTHKINHLTYTLHSRFNALGLSTLHQNSVYDKYVSYLQQHYFANRQTTPPGMEAIRAKMLS